MRALDQPVAHQPLDGIVDRHRSDAEALREIDRTHVAVDVQKIGD